MRAFIAISYDNRPNKEATTATIMRKRKSSISGQDDDDDDATWRIGGGGATSLAKVWKNKKKKKTSSPSTKRVAAVVSGKKKASSIVPLAAQEPKAAAENDFWGFHFEKRPHCKWCLDKRREKMIAWSCGCSLSMNCQRSNFCNRIENPFHAPNKKLKPPQKSSGKFSIRECVGCRGKDVYFYF